MRFKKSYGQNFLRDKKYISKIVKALPIEDEVVVEIGPGSGVVTRCLVDKVKHLYAIEKDVSLIGLLNERFASSKVDIINQDILEFKLPKVKNGVVVFGNIPYNISYQIISYLIENRAYIKDAYITFQKEFAYKLDAPIGSKGYSFLSCYSQYYIDSRVLVDIPRGAFFPVPKVDSAFVKMTPFEKLPFEVKDEEFLFNLIKKAFSERRKKTVNVLGSLYGKKALIELFSKLNISPELRPQDLSLKNYCDLTSFILE